MSWDWNAQKADTQAVFNDLAGRIELARGAKISLDIQTVPDSAEDRAAYLAALKMKGWRGNAYSDDDGIETIEVSFEDVAFDPDHIWQMEKAVTEVALEHGYRPDGWGFYEPEG